MSTFILNRDIDVENMTIQDIAKHYEGEVERYKEHVKTLGDDLNVLAEEEKFAIAYIEAEEKRMAEFKGYVLPEKITIGNEDLSKAVIATKIRKFIDRCEIPFTYTLGYLQAFRFWEKPTKHIDHNMLDSTLRILGDQKLMFKGHAEWESILAINAYFDPLKKEFNLNKIYTILGAELHNVVLDAMKLNETEGE